VTHEVEFDKTVVIVNRGRLYVDGRELHKRAVHYGESTVRGELLDRRPFKVEFGSSFVGQLKHVDLVLGDERIPLEEVKH